MEEVGNGRIVLKSGGEASGAPWRMVGTACFNSARFSTAATAGDIDLASVFPPPRWSRRLVRAYPPKRGGGLPLSALASVSERFLPLFFSWLVSSLLQDLIYRVLSKLTTKEVVRTSALSSIWKHVWEFCPKLRFNSTAICGPNMCGTQQHVQKFADEVSATLQRYQGKMVVELDIKLEYDNLLADHVDSWVDFALSSSSVKNLALDLVPACQFKADLYGHDGDRYMFPTRKNLDNRCLSHLQQLQLSFLSFQLPPQFNGFPNLRKLELHLVRVSRKDLEDMLSSCLSLEWLSMVRCHLNSELKMAQPLSHLIYLRVECCNITSMELNAPSLKTFICSDIGLGPVDIGDALEVRDASLFYVSYPMILEHALTVLPKDFPSMQRLILHASIPLEVPELQECPHKFSHLKYLQLRLLLASNEEAYNIISLTSFLSAAPLIEKFECHVRLYRVRASRDAYWMPIRSYPCHPYDRLKNLHLTGFMGCTGQLEFLIHCVENAPILGVLTIDPANVFCKDTEYERETYWLARDIAKRHLDGIISPNTKLRIM